MSIFGGIFRGDSTGGGGISNEFYAYASGNLTIAPGPPVTMIADTEVYDPDSAYNASTGEYTVPENGLYEFEAQIRSQPAEVANLQIIIAKAPYAVEDLIQVLTEKMPSDASFVYMTNLKTVPVPLVAGDVVKFLATWDGSGNHTAYAALSGTFFAGRRVK